MQESINTFHIYKELNLSHFKGDLKPVSLFSLKIYESMFCPNLQIFSLCKDNMVWCRSSQITSCRQCWIESIFFLYNYIWDLSIFYEIKCVNNWFPVCNGVIDGPGLTKLYCFFFPQQIREPLKRVSSSLISFWFRNMPMGNLTLTIKKAPLLSVHVIKIPSSSSLERKKVASSLSRH